jgi:hypothetical protein
MAGGSAKRTDGTADHVENSEGNRRTQVSVIGPGTESATTIVSPVAACTTAVAAC